MLFEVSGLLYLVWDYTDPITINSVISILKSTDRGQTWAELDAAHRPVGAEQGGIYAFLDGTVIRVLYQAAATGFPMYIQSMDISAGSPMWTTVSPPLTTNFGSPPSVAFYKKTDGTFVALMAHIISGTQTLFYATYDGTNWSALNTLTTLGFQMTIMAYLAGVTDTGRFVYMSTQGTAHAFYQELSSAFALSSAVDLGTATRFSRATMNFPTSDSVSVAFIDADLASVIYTTGTPLGTPSFTRTVVAVVPAGHTASYATLELDNQGRETIFWVDLGGEPTDRLMMSTLISGLWSTPVVFYDAVTNPPPDGTDPSIQFIHTGEGIQLANNNWVFATAMETLSACTGFILLSSGGTPSITLACPTSTAQVGVPYSSPFVVTGGTPPYTFAIIAGMLPPGLTLDTTTGVVSGTPTTPGNYTYTGKVTDANGLTATATCTISIPVPLSASCPSQSSIAIGVPYSGTITVTGGTPPYTFALTGGALPPGLSLNTSTGVISGTPTTAGTFPYQITITDSVGGTFVLNCSFGVSSCPSFTLVQECSPIR